jgi:FdhD protein
MPVVQGSPSHSAAPTVAVATERWQGDVHRNVDDQLVVEAPLEIRLGDAPLSVLLRTPGHDVELALGLLWSEGLLRRRSDLLAVTRPDCDGHPHQNVVEVALAEAPGRPVPERVFLAAASCGACGKRSLDGLSFAARPITSRLTVARTVLASLPERLRAAQPVFATTGGLHGAALFTADAALLAAREDIGRHNAVDKLIGWAFEQDRLPLADAILCVSGRLGFEIAQKAIMAGIPLVAAVGAASSLAVELAARHGQTLVTFLRPESMNVFGAAGRVRV